MERWRKDVLSGENMLVLTIDFETRSTSNLKKQGMYKYAVDPSTLVLCLVVSINDGPERLWLPPSSYRYTSFGFWDRFTGISTEELGYWAAVADQIVGHNVNFERCIWRERMVKVHGLPEVPLKRWRCTAAKAAALALPRALEDVGYALGLPIRKDKAGHRLMLKWCKPKKPTKKHPSIWADDKNEFINICQYCVQDVRVERMIDEQLPDLTKSEQELWFLDQIINDKGVCVDVDDIENLQQKVRNKNEALVAEVPGLGFAGIEKPTQTKKIIQLVNDYGIETDTIDAEHLKEYLTLDLDPRLKRLLEIRQLTNKTSVSKLETMRQMVQDDGRVRGSIMYHGAATGRWAAKGLQLHNYPRTDYKDEDIRNVCDLSLFDLESEHGSVHSVVSKALRGMLRAAPGHKFYNFDFSNIEGRLAAWIAGEQWKVDSFYDFDAGIGADNYILAYSRAYGVPIEDVTDDQRQIGKTMELALQFQGWIGALLGMAEKFGIVYDEDTATELCGLWRDSHPAIKSAWYTIHDTAIAAIIRKKVYKWRNIVIGCDGTWLRVKLPSGRIISYYKPYVFEKEHYGRTKKCLGYQGVHKKTRKWSRECSTHGGDIFQSIVQGTGRDNLAFAMHNLAAAGFPIVMHVHDECTAEILEKEDRYEEFLDIAAILPPWAEGLPLAVSGWEGLRYRK